MGVKVFLHVLRPSPNRCHGGELPGLTVRGQGYVGGHALDHLVRAQPDYEYTVLVRDERRGARVAAEYPAVKIVYGRLEDGAVLEKAAAEADVIVHTADSADHYAAAEAIAKGLRDGHTADRPGYWIHTSGTALLTWYDAEHGRQGAAPLAAQSYDDVDDVQRITSLPDSAPHRDVDKLAVGANSAAVRVAVVCPPTIYGTGGGRAGNPRSRQVPGLARATLRSGFAPVVGAGRAEWDHVHVDDLARLLAALVAATQHPARRRDPDLFGPRAYFFAAAGSHAWAALAQCVADEAARQGFLPAPRTAAVEESAVLLMDGGSLTWGRNARGVAARARRFLGWQPCGPPLEDTIPEVVAREAKDLGLARLGGEKKC